MPLTNPQDVPTDSADVASAVPRTALVLGVAGVVPLLAGAAALAAAPLLALPLAEDRLLGLLLSYGAVLLSFLGGVRRGSGLHHLGRWQRTTLAASIAPPLTGWIALVLPGTAALAALAAAFAAQGAWDAIDAHRGFLPAWYGRLRTRLTLVTVAALIVALAAVPNGL